MSNELLTCAICGAEIRREEANNPDPIIKDDTSVCCRKCNTRFVVPARERLLRALNEEREKTLEIVTEERKTQ